MLWRFYLTFLVSLAQLVYIMLWFGYVSKIPGPPPVSDVAEKLKLWVQKHDGKGEPCSICLAELSNSVITLQSCKHTFHAKCVTEWASQ